MLLAAAVFTEVMMRMAKTAAAVCFRPPLLPHDSNTFSCSFFGKRKGTVLVGWNNRLIPPFSYLLNFLLDWLRDVLLRKKQVLMDFVHITSPLPKIWISNDISGFYVCMLSLVAFLALIFSRIFDCVKLMLNHQIWIKQRILPILICTYPSA